MRRIPSAFLFAVILLALFASPSPAENYWVFFVPAPEWSAGDPVPPECAGKVRGAGAEIRTVSRYFHAVSAEFSGNPSALEAIPGVNEVRPVRAFRRPPDPAPVREPAAVSPAKPAESVYGVMLDEMTALDIPPLHERGLTGKGVTVGLLDAGFNSLSTTGCLRDLTVAHTRNFLTGGADPSGNRHGSWVLSCLAGKETGGYTSAAYGATFLLAVTEDPSREVPAEEDRWVAGIEWCDSLGADIVSSSLIYNTFDDSVSAHDYTRADMDGKTSLVAKASEIAVSRGIVVVNSAGNERNNSWHIIGTPADAEHVITVGAVADFGTGGTDSLAVFSSVGPTADDRIKPDVVAPGAGVSVPVLGTSGSHTTVSGTSVSAPLISGLCALILEAHPDWTPADVMSALRSSARDLGSAGPDTLYGYGLPDGVKAVDAGSSVAGGDGGYENHPGVFSLGTPHPNPFNPSVVIPVRMNADVRAEVAVYDVTGRRAATLAAGRMSAGEHEFVWNARGFASGVYFARVSAGGRAEARKIVLVK